MKLTSLDGRYWTDRYVQGTTGWDIGYASPPIQQYLDQIENKGIRILIPGAGNAYEAQYAYVNGFKNVYVLDISGKPLESLKTRMPAFPKEQLLLEDFFHHTGKYDLILEQTFFCALHPDLRELYVENMKELLHPGGKLVGVLFDRQFHSAGPPFGGNLKDYMTYFQSHFRIHTWEPCYNSIEQRMGTELFMILEVQ